LNAHHHILLVEDDRIDAMTVMRALRDLGSTNPLHHVTDGEKALTFLVDPASPRPMLILLDLNMPRMNGTEFLAVIKADDLFRAIPVVVLTTSQEDRDRLRAFDLSAAGYMVKPVDYPQFVDVMRTIRNYWIRSETPPI
jgi:CheY-like chemotaxis protein